jgi:type II secretory pathway predicted ATPase ExeA
MYESYFRLREPAFNVTPNPRFFYANSSHREAFATLSYGVERRKGIIVITGEAGTGKTTLLRRFVQNPGATIHLSYIVDPHLNFIELLRCASDAFGLAHCPDRLAMLGQLNQYLREQFKKDHIVALLFDEAQDLNDELLEELRLLSDLENGGEKLVQIVLVGQSELESRLAKPPFHQLNQRVALRSRLAPLSREEISPYIECRLSAAGYAGKTLFATSAIERIAVHSKGIPRLINVICDNALVITYSISQNGVGAETIEEVAGELQLEGFGRPLTGSASTETPRWGVPDDFAGHVIIGERGETLAEDRWVLARENFSGTNGEQRAATERDARKWKRRSLAYLMVALGGTTLFFFRQESGFHLSPAAQFVEQIKEVIAPIPGRIYRILTTHGLNGNTDSEGFKVKSPGPDEGKFLNLESRRHFGSLAMTRKGSPETIQGDGNKSRAETDLKRSDQTASVKTTHQTPSRQQGREEKKAVQVVVDNSFVRDEPTSSAEIIATLRPGARVQLMGRKGDYWQIRSLRPEVVRGYVHREDAFFEPLQ